jgi:hypothetical protein
MKTINEALSYVQKNLKAPKNQKNAFGKYSYRNAEDILQALKKLDVDGLFIVLSDEAKLVGDRVYIESTATVTFAGESISSRASAREALVQKGMSCPQTSGSASSYARKYALGGLLSIDGSECDPDAQDNTDAHEPEHCEPMVVLKEDREWISRCAGSIEGSFSVDEWNRCSTYLIAANKGNVRYEVWAALSDETKQWIKDNMKKEANNGS